MEKIAFISLFILSSTLKWSLGDETLAEGFNFVVWCVDINIIEFVRPKVSKVKSLREKINSNSAFWCLGTKQ